ncbi:cell surface protein [Streptococcus gallolyticus]|uniref:cell surface protein n=1 Tax=Streptococcus gallolyticus TaxID=315405 RepID=UPI002284D783|nr:cell surface protein [Streptococcus gallolyticus]MCY7177385.1 cell surface protein [Streptococcus gallolyticus subsp. gallolyticus]MCY7194038.1 cell surface protein [Streptococcus gallolyticus subsp. gallolyticus]
MKKSKILTMVTVSTLVLTQAGTAFADESDIVGTVDDTVVVTPSTTGSDSSTNTQTDTSNVGDDVNETIDTGSSEVIETPTTTNDSSSETTPSTETDVVGETTQTETSESENSDTQTDSEETQTETSDSQTENDTSQQNQETGTVEVPTTIGETATVNTDKSQPTNNPNVSAQTAYDAGVSQVGTTSQVTGQIVRDVTVTNPVTLISGVTITDIQAGVATLSDGSNANLTDLGVTENADKTFTATTIDGEQVTLPETGESTVGVVVGLLIILAGIGLGYKDKLKALIDNVKAKFKK